MTYGDLIKRSDLVLRPNFGLRINWHEFFKRQQELGLVTEIRQNFGLGNKIRPKTTQSLV